MQDMSSFIDNDLQLSTITTQCQAPEEELWAIFVKC